MPQIKSNPDPEDPRPWFEFSIDETNMKAEFTKANGLKNFPDAAPDAALDTVVENVPHQLDPDADHPNEPHLLIATLDGSIEFLPKSKLPAVCYAHLAEYDPETDTWDKLEFVEQ